MEWEMICRVCLQGGDMVSLFDCDENNELLSDKYMYCSSIEVLETEPLPSNICLTCVDRLMSAYQFRQQCIASNDTLKECLTEFQKSNASSGSVKKGTEVITIKQENGVYLQYEIPIEEESASKWPTIRTPPEPIKRKRGRPRKYPDASGMIPMSPYIRRDQRQQQIQREQQTQQQLIEKLKEEPLDEAVTPEEEVNDSNRPDSPLDDGEVADYTTDPDYVPGAADNDDKVSGSISGDKDVTLVQLLKNSVGKLHGRRGRPKKSPSVKAEADSEKEEEDVLLKETILANSEPIPDYVLNSQLKDKKKYPKKKYFYDKIHTCDQCGSSFRSNASLQAHIRRHLGIKPFSCSICGYSCVLNMELRRHMMRHTGVKPYKCRICDRHFGDFGSRQKHERLHLGERPYQCSLCGKSFTYSYVLSNHMLTHTGEKKHECQPCKKRFTKAHHLKYHNKVHHKELYNQELLLQESKKAQMLQNVHISELTSVCTEELLGLQGAQIVGDTIQIHGEESMDQDGEQQYIENDQGSQQYVENEHVTQEYTENEQEGQEFGEGDNNSQEYVATKYSQEFVESEHGTQEFSGNEQGTQEYTENEQGEYAENEHTSQEYTENDDASQEFVEHEQSSQEYKENNKAAVQEDGQMGYQERELGEVQEIKEIQIIHSYGEDEDSVKSMIWKKRLPFEE